MKKKTFFWLLFPAMVLPSCGGTALSAKKAPLDLWVNENPARKVQQQITYTPVETALNVSLAKNEYEGAEIVLTAQEDIASFDVSVSDFVGPNGASIPASDIEISQEYYAHTLRSSNQQYAPGYYPDALIPFALAKQKGINHITKGQNQGIYFKVHTTKTTVAGTYQGTFSVKVGNDVSAMPVTLTVWDWTVPDEVHTRSSFLLYPIGLTAGEGDSTLAEVKRYYDFFLNKYRISLMNLPSTMEPDSFLSSVREYYDNPKFTAFNLSYNVSSLQMLDHVEIDLKQLVYASVQDQKNYLRKCYLYNLYNDEYSMKDDNAKYQAYLFSKNFTELCNNLVTFFDKNYGTSYLDQVDGLRDSLANILNLEVTGYVDTLRVGSKTIENLSSAHNGICPVYSQFHTKAQRDFLHEKYDGEHHELWWYGCIEPCYPAPTYHIDDSELSPRIISWMQYDYGIDGNLYFSVNNQFDYDGTYIPNIIDNYDGNPNHAFSQSPNGVNGDGYLVYPGYPFGTKDPIPSLRLENIREGLEEYEYLYVYQSLLDGLSTRYGIEGLSANRSLRSILDTLYSGVYPTTKGQRLLDARESVNRAIALAKLGVVMKDMVEDTNGFTATMEFPAGTTVDDTSLPSNVTYTKNQVTSHDEYVFVVTKTEGIDSRLSFSYTLPNESSARSYDSRLAKAIYWKYKPSASDTSLFGASRYGTVTTTYQMVDNLPAMEFTYANDASNTLKVPYVSLTNRFVTSQLSNDMTSLTFMLYNEGDNEVTVQVQHLGADTAETDVEGVVLPAKQWTSVTFDTDNPANWGWIHLGVVPEQSADNDTTYQAVSAKIALGKVGYSK
jgi:hypothetical protein